MKATGVTLAIAFAAHAQADVVIQTRSAEYRSDYTATFGSPASSSYRDVALVNELRPSGNGVVDVRTFHNEHFTSTASPAQISAQMQGDTGYGALVSRDYYSHSAWLAVVFDVTDATTAASLTFNGEIFPLASQPRITGFTFQIINMTTGQTVFDVLDDAPPAVIGTGLRRAEWHGVSWSGLLDPGRYMLTTQALPEGTYSAGGGSGGSGGTTVTFAMTFGPGVAPSLAPTPSAAALTAILPALAFRRRR